MQFHKMLHFVLIFLVFCCIDKTTSSQIPCGLRSKNSSIWPWHVAISRQNPDPEYPSCGGTILNDLYVITAGHCLYDLAGNEFKSSLLVVTVDRPRARRSFYVKKVIFPDRFDVNKFENDVVLVKLDQSVAFSEEVGPICFTEDVDVFPTGTVTIPIFTKQSKTVLTVEWNITNYYLCHGTNHYIFNSSYNHSVCMGYIRSTDKFQLYRGSGLMINRNSSWHLAGILLYTVGPNEYTPTYGGGIVLTAYVNTIKKIVNRHLVPSVSDKKCTYYNEIGKEKPLGFFDPYIALQRKHDDFIQPGCIGTLISETFILSAATCTNSLESIRLWLGMVNITYHNDFRFHFHPNDIYHRGIALIELDRNASYMEYFIHCLWTNDEDPFKFDTQIRHGIPLLSTTGIHVEYKLEEAISYRFNECSHFSVSMLFKPGDVLATKRAGENVNSVVGLITGQVEDCNSGTALNVVSYLNWIEETVWKNDTRS